MTPPATGLRAGATALTWLATHSPEDKRVWGVRHGYGIVPWISRVVADVHDDTWMLAGWGRPQARGFERARQRHDWGDRERATI